MPIHPKSMNALKKYISESLNSCDLKKDYNLAFGDHLKSLDLIAKQVERMVPGFNLLHVYGCFQDRIFDALRSKHSSTVLGELEGSVQTLLGEEIFSSLIASVQNELCNLPKDYVVMISLPSLKMQDQNDIKLTSSVKLQHVTQEEAKKYGGSTTRRLSFNFQTPEIRENMSYLRAEIKGYAHSYHLCPVAVEIQQMIREIFTALYVFNFIEVPYPSHNISAWEGIGVPIIVYEKSKEHDAPLTITLPFQIEAFLKRIKMTDAIYKEPLLPFLSSGESSVDFNLRTLRQFLESDDENARRIRASLEWFGFSIMESNETFSFIQAVTALEALLGEDTEDRGIRQQLGDRCSFLLGKTTGQRKAWKDIFQDIYDIRSKIIHGRERTLNRGASEAKRKLDNVMMKLIRAEISNHVGSLR